jgi:hypothetical protein
MQMRKGCEGVALGTGEFNRAREIPGLTTEHAALETLEVDVNVFVLCVVTVVTTIVQAELGEVGDTGLNIFGRGDRSIIVIVWRFEPQGTLGRNVYHCDCLDANLSISMTLCILGVVKHCSPFINSLIWLLIAA